MLTVASSGAATAVVEEQGKTSPITAEGEVDDNVVRAEVRVDVARGVDEQGGRGALVVRPAISIRRNQTQEAVVSVRDIGRKHRHQSAPLRRPHTDV